MLSITAVRKSIKVVRKWRQMKKHYEKTSGHDSKIEVQKRIKQNCFHHRSSSTLDGGIALGTRGIGNKMVRDIGVFRSRSGDARQEA